MVNFNSPFERYFPKEQLKELRIKLTEINLLQKDKEPISMYTEGQKIIFCIGDDDQKNEIICKHKEDANKFLDSIKSDLLRFEKSEMDSQTQIFSRKDLEKFIANKTAVFKELGIQFELEKTENFEEILLRVVIDYNNQKEIFGLPFQNENSLIEFLNNQENSGKKTKSFYEIVQQIESISTPEIDKNLILSYLKKIEEKINYFKLKNKHPNFIVTSAEEMENGKIRIVFKEENGTIIIDHEFDNWKKAGQDVKGRYDHIDNTINNEQIKEDANKINNIKKQIDGLYNQIEIKDVLNDIVKEFNQKSKKLKIEIKVNDDFSVEVFMKTENNGRIIESKTIYKNPEEFINGIKRQKID